MGPGYAAKALPPNRCSSTAWRYLKSAVLLVVANGVALG